MDLKRLERVWDSLGRRDPYWAVLTHAGKSRGRWSEAEFFRTGEDDIARLFATAAARGSPRSAPAARSTSGAAPAGSRRLWPRASSTWTAWTSRRRCSRWRARAIASARGASITTTSGRRSTGLAQVRSTSSDRFSRFSTFQPAFARRYLAELVRVLAPGGLLVLQAPSHRGPIEPDTGDGTAHTMATRKLPRSACQARVTLDRQDLTTGAGQRLLLGVTVRNQGDSVWPSAGGTTGATRSRSATGGGWPAAKSSSPTTAAPRCRTISSPAATCTCSSKSRRRSLSGDYRLDVDVVQEHVAWFSEYGSQATTAAARVEGGPARPPARARRGFRARFPRLHRTAVALGLDAARGSIRLVRASIRRKAERDQTGRWHSEAMMMYCLPRRSVTDLVAQAGGRLLHVDQELVPAGFQDCCYWVTKS